MIDWKRKFTSRKFWAMLAGFVTGLIVFINSPEKSPEAITGLIMSAGSLISYIIGEGIADGGNHISEGIPIIEESGDDE